MSYDVFSKKQISEKGLIAWLEPAEWLREWQLHSGFIYKRVVNFFAINLKQDGQVLTQVNSILNINSSGKWYFDSNTKTIYFWAIGNGDPSLSITTIFYRIAFSTFPYNGPIDDNNRDVEYLPVITSAARFNHALDHEDQIGIALSSSSSITMINDSFFISYFDRLVWENKRCRVWSFSPELNFSDKKIYFDGRIEDKRFTSNDVQFLIKDFLAVLKNQVPLNNYLSSDNFDIDNSQIGKAKRRIYGRVSGLQVISLNKVLDGFLAQGTFSGTAGSTTITGIGSNLLTVLSYEDKVKILDKEYKVESINSNTSFTVSEEIEDTFSGEQMIISPEIESIRTGRNTEFLISDGHALKAATAQILDIIQLNRFKLDNVDGFVSGDLVNINGDIRTVVSISTNDVIILNQTVNAPVIVGDFITRNPVQRVFANGQEFTIDRDYSVINLTSGSKLIFDSLAEFNVSRPKIVAGGTFTGGSNIVSFSNINTKVNFKPRDWIRPNNIAFTNWAEILKINEDTGEIILRSNWAYANYSGDVLHKSISPIGDDTIVTVECFGKTKDNTSTGDWIKYGPEIVYDLLQEAGVDQNINISSFNFASKIAPHLMSMAIPLGPSENAPTIRDVIELVNKSIFGSLHYNSDFEIEYSVLNGFKPNILPEQVVTDSDVIDWDVSSSSKNLISNAKVNFRHEDAERFSGKRAARQIEHTSIFAKYVVENERSETYDFYLWNERSAQIMVQRKVFFNEISQSILTLSTDLEYVNKAINSKILVQFDRLYARLGSVNGEDRRKIMIISGISKGENGVELTLDDLGNLWNRVATITSNDAPIFDDSGDERILNGYITDANGLIANLHETSKLNLIG